MSLLIIREEICTRSWQSYKMSFNLHWIKLYILKDGWNLISKFDFGIERDTVWCVVMWKIGWHNPLCGIKT